MDGPTAPKKGTRLKAATMLESVLALGLLASAASTAAVIHQRTLMTSHSFARMTVWGITEHALEEQIRDPLSPPIEAGPGLDVQLEVVPLGDGLEEVRISCEADGRMLLERRVLRAAP